MSIKTIPRRTGAETRDGVGASAHRVDGVPKVKGQFQFGSDLWADGMLWGVTLRSPHAHARIRSIDISKAIATPGVHAVLVAADVPGRKTYGLEFADQPVLAHDPVRYAGESVAILAAIDMEIGRQAAKAIAIDYEVLPAVTDMGQALRTDTPRVHEFGNVLRHVRILHGDPHAPADVWVEGYYETGMQDQAPLGPEAGLAIPATDGGVDLYVATQWLHVDQEQVAPCLGLPKEKVRLYLAGVGGAFGAREDVSMHIHACMLALRTGKPVKMIYGREESFYGHVHRHPARMWMRHGARCDGTLVTVIARLLMDGGAYASSSAAVILNASTFAAGPYAVPNASIEGTCVYTNNPPCGAMRGFGAVQACFAYEAQMDKLAASLEMDPIALRMQNALVPGSVLPTGQAISGSAPLREVIARCAAIPMPPDSEDAGSATRKPLALPGGAGNVSRGEGLRRGVGFAIGYKNIAYSEGFDDSAEVRVRLFAGPLGATAEVYSAAAEVGQGIHTVLTQIARTELGVEHVVIRPADTAIGSAGSSSASRQTMMSGGAALLACQAIRDTLFERLRARGTVAGKEFGALRLTSGAVLAGDTPIAPIEAFLGQPIEAARTYHHRKTRALDARGQGDPHVTLAFAAQRAIVDVDLDLGLARVVQIATAQDVGRAINPQSVHGQIEGGTAQGVGLALMEEIRLTQGLIRNASFTDYLIPTMLDMPSMISVLIEEPEPGSPYGLKGVGELSTVVSTAAVAAALRRATGRELNRVPVKPDDLAGLATPVTSCGRPPSPDVPGPEPVPKSLGLSVPPNGPEDRLDSV